MTDERQDKDAQGAGGKRKSGGDDFINVDNLVILDFPAAAPSASKGSGRKPPKKPPHSSGGDSGGDGSAAPPDDEDGGRIIACMNRQFAFILLGATGMIMRENPNALPKDKLRFLSLEAFKAYLVNRGSFIKKRALTPDGICREKTKFVKWATLWLNAASRRTFDGIDFYPDPNGAVRAPSYFNLWRGFGCVPDDSDPRERPLAYKTFRDHLFIRCLVPRCAGMDRP
ncbi:MAG: hypothetical protein ACREDD_04980 [Methylocella sp.]